LNSGVLHAESGLIESDTRGAGLVERDIIAPQPNIEIIAPQQATMVAPVQQMLDNRLIVGGLLLCGGPMALPALWLSRSFSPTTKTITTIGYTLLTVVMPIAVTWYFMNAALWPLLEAFKR